MQATVDRSTLRDALKAVAPAVLTRGYSNPVLSCVRLTFDGGALMVEADSLDLAARAAVPARGDAGEVVVSHQLLSRVLAAGTGSGAIDLATGDGQLSIVAGAMTAELRTADPKGWPQRTPLDGDPVKIGADRWRLVQRAARYTDPTHESPSRWGVRFIHGSAAATDSYRLAVVQLDQAPDRPALIPAAAILAHPDAEVTVELGEHAAVIDGETVTYTTRLIDTDWPDEHYRKVIPEPTASATVDREALVAAVKAGQAVATGETRQTVLTVAPGQVTVEARSLDVGEIATDVDADTTSEVRATFTTAYLLDLIDGDDDQVTLGWIDDLKPWIVADEAAGWTSVLMPVNPKLAGL